MKIPRPASWRAAGAHAKTALTHLNMSVRAESLRPRDFVEKSQAARFIAFSVRLIENSVAIITCEQLEEAQGTHMAAMCCEPGAPASGTPAA